MIKTLFRTASWSSLKAKSPTEGDWLKKSWPFRTGVLLEISSRGPEFYPSSNEFHVSTWLHWRPDPNNSERFQIARFHSTVSRLSYGIPRYTIDARSYTARELKQKLEAFNEQAKAQVTANNQYREEQSARLGWLGWVSTPKCKRVTLGPPPWRARRALTKLAAT